MKKQGLDLNTLEDSGAKSLLQKLQAALRADGDFPVRARVVSELRRLADNPNSSINQITDVILREPSLGTRVIHLVNSTFYRRAYPIITISQAVIQLGTRTLADLCAGLVLMHKFLPTAKRGGIFADGIKRTILTSLITSHIVAKKKREGLAERAYLAGTFHNIGFLLLAYYFPQVYEAAGKRAHTRGHDITQSIVELLGVSRLDLSLSIVDSLDIPDYYRELVIQSHRTLAEREGDEEILILAQALSIGADIAQVILTAPNMQVLNENLKRIALAEKIDLAELLSLSENLDTSFREHAEMLELSFLTLPGYLAVQPDKTLSAA